jgi:hypothetical protein
LTLRAANDDSEAEYARLLDQILQVQPNNLKVLAERAKAALGRLDRATFKDTLDQFRRLSGHWSAATRNRLGLIELEFSGKGKVVLDARAVCSAASICPIEGQLLATSLLVPGLFMGEPRDELSFDLATLANLLAAERGFARDAATVNPTLNAIGKPLRQFVHLTPLRTAPDAPDLWLTFSPGPVPGAALDLDKERWDVVQPIWLTGEGQPDLFVANARIVRRVDGKGISFPFPSGTKQTPPVAGGVLAADWNNDGRTDLLLAGAGGLRFWQQDKEGNFVEVTSKTRLEPAILNGDYVAAWAIDIDSDGDVDIVLAPRQGQPLVLRNNQDGTFAVLRPFAEVDGLRCFTWADFDDDGAPDAALLDARGRLHVYAGQRSGQFRLRETPANLGRLVALAAAVLTDDSAFDLLALREDGVVFRLSDRDRGKGWDKIELARGLRLPTDSESGAARLLVGDLDNNGMLDLVASGPKETRVWLGEQPDHFVPLRTDLPGRVFAAEDLTGKGRLDLIAISALDQPQRLANSGTKNYHWLAVRPKTDRTVLAGDNRINSQAIGGDIEMRAGTLVQKQAISKPRVHFGLGNRQKSDLIRIVWPNGIPQVELALAANQVTIATQRLKGSCPFLFTWDGHGFQFVKDFMWSTPLGLSINAQETAGITQTEEWVKIGGDQLVPREGFYDVRIAATLWETDFFDYLALGVVDHPAGTEVFVDERFALTPTPPQLVLTNRPRPVAHAWDDTGTDVTDIVKEIDGRYLDTFGRGLFQGVTRDHWVEVDLGDEAPTEGPVWLLAHGWIHPTDSSINVSMGQGRHEPPRPLVLEVPDGKGGWRAGLPPLGFPAGKNKTMLIRLDGINGKGVARHFRLRTNMEIYWDALHYAVGLDASGIKQRQLAPEVAELRYRGFLEITQANASSPELPHYDKVETANQRWRDLIGYYTRFGDIRELLASIDDRYAIVNAGDEIVLRFRVPNEPPAGWKRDFICLSDGWTKDGDFNTRYSKTVLPLPSHDQKGYDRPPGLLQDDPVYQRFPDDWRQLHTRYVTPYQFERGLRPPR